MSPERRYRLRNVAHKKRASGTHPPSLTGVQEKKPTKVQFKRKPRSRKQLREDLEEKVAAMEPEAALLEQCNLLGVTASPNTIPSAPAAESESKVPKRFKGKGGRKKKSEHKFMDDFLLLSDWEEKQEGEKCITLRREDRWIPDMEHRRRFANRPHNIPFQIWMAYSMLDEYIYRQALTEDELRTYPLIDDVLHFQHGGPQPIIPAGFQCNAEGRIVPIEPSGIEKWLE